MLHEGERAVQRRAGVTAESRGSARVGATVPPVAAEFLARQRMLVIGAVADDGAVWTSLLTGPPRFVTAADDRTVVAARPPGAPLAGLFESERDVGLLAIEPAARRRMRINGRAKGTDGRLTVHTEQVYANCPKYIQTRTPSGDGPAAAAGPARRTPRLTEEQQRWIAAADTFFVTTHAAGLGVDASHRGGHPGFVTVTGERRLTWPDYIGNSMYMTLGNLELDSRCGLLFLDWEHGHTLHLTGRARTDWDPHRAADTPGAQRMVDFEVEQVVQIDEASSLRWSFGEYSRFNPARIPSP